MTSPERRCKYYCKDCGKKELVKVVYTEYHCRDCGRSDYHPHRIRVRKD